MSSALGAAVVDVPLAAGTWDAAQVNYRWTRSTSLQIRNPQNNALIATLLNADVTVKTGAVAEIHVNVGFTAGASPTDIVVLSPMLTVRRIPVVVATGRASASMTVSDLNGDSGSVQSLGTLGSGMYRSQINGVYPSGIGFSDLVAMVYAGATGTATGTQNDPPFGYRPVGAYVDTIQSRIAFRVTPGDRAYATTRTGFPDAPWRCGGDVDADGDVDTSDLSTVLASFGDVLGGARYNINADLDGDGVVGLFDLSTVLNYYGLPCVHV